MQRRKGRVQECSAVRRTTVHAQGNGEIETADRAIVQALSLLKSGSGHVEHLSFAAIAAWGLLGAIFSVQYLDARA
ncbi:hypothetical protein BCV70DRAFT_197607 [Testicularia cyperi]|uniref:Uncharacterized protein n=1 Tax=Testicularia cyperi TaxID=1882483 RepID=A0A317Y014_9BASI|nr:hypothetical protein BCV70DRAFT_197607 [Testicularia cyperi]